MRLIHMLRILLGLLLLASGIQSANAGRVALVVGNGSYQDRPLRNPGNDAALMQRTLSRLGFEVVVLRDADRKAMLVALREFEAKAKDADVALFYFAGHGVQVGGVNYLIPVRAQIRAESDVSDEAIDAGTVLRRIEDARAKVGLVILDACRDNPYAGATRSATRGLARMSVPTGSILAYSTAPGTTAIDGDGANGIYTQQLARFLAEPGIELRDVFDRTAMEVERITQGKQRPREEVGLRGKFSLSPPQAAQVAAMTRRDAGVTASAPAAAPAPPPAAPPTAVAVPPAQPSSAALAAASKQMEQVSALLDAGRWREALKLTEAITREQPAVREPWLTHGWLLLQADQLDRAEQALRTYVDGTLALSRAKEDAKYLRGAYLDLAQISAKRGDNARANGWLDKAGTSSDPAKVRYVRALLRAKEGRIDEARKMVRSTPAKSAEDKRDLLSLELSLLAENGLYQEAYDLTGSALKNAPDDTGLMSTRASVAKMLGNHAESDRLLRAILKKDPKDYSACNELGFNLADRGVQLQEARELVQRALAHAPGDPLFQDSLGWVEFRLGNRKEALRLLREANAQLPHESIAAHLGEVLWASGEREEAKKVWRQGMRPYPAPTTLSATLKRLDVKL